MNDMAVDPTNGPMGRDMMVSSGTTKPMAREPFDFRMGEFTKANGNLTGRMAAAATGILTRPAMMASGAMTSSMVKVSNFGPMVRALKGNTGKGKRVAKAVYIGQMDPAMKVTLKPIPFMVKGCTVGPMEKSTVANGPKTG